MLVIDGFTVRNCFATNTGGGIMLDPRSTWTNIIRNCIISNNTVAWGYDFSSFGGGTPGYASRGGGIGVQVFAINFYPIISNCTIIGNRALNGVGTERGEGGGICFSYATLNGVIDNCLIQSNSAYYGGGYRDVSAVPLIKNSVVRDNTGTFGGGIYAQAYGGARNCLIYNNYAGEGAGIYIVHGTSYSIENCTIVGNRPNNNGAGVTAKYIDLGTKMRMWNSIVMSNGTAANGNLLYNFAGTTIPATNIIVSNSCIICTLDLPGSSNNIADNPRFSDFAGQNYRLAPNSPCVNRGTNQTWMTNGVDLDGNTRIRYGTVDMGAYELIYDGSIYRFR